MLQKLLIDKSISQVIAVSRRPLSINNPKIKEVLISNFESLLSHQDELRGDIYFCALGTTIKTAGSQENFRKVDYDAVVNFGKVAEANSAQSFTVVSANMASPDSKIFYNKTKGEAEVALMAMKFNRLIILRPGLLIGERTENRTGEKLAIKVFNLLSPVLPSKIEKSMGTKIDDLTKRMIKEGQNPAPKIKIINAVDI